MTMINAILANAVGPIIGNTPIFLNKHYLIRMKSTAIEYKVEQPRVNISTLTLNESIKVNLNVREAILKKVYKNIGYFKYLDNTSVTIPLSSDKILCRLKESTGNSRIFSFGSVPLHLIDVWSAYADFRVWQVTVFPFEGVMLPSIQILSVRPCDDSVSYYPINPRFNVGEIVLTDYDGKLSNIVPGVEYGYARIDRICKETLSLGLDKVSVISYSIRRSWKGISKEDYSRFFHITDCIEEGKLSIRKLPENLQSKIRFQLFDPFYR